jgi:hypothetical protein
MPETAANLYRTALKPSTALPSMQSAWRVQTGLTEEIPVSQGGQAKLGELMDDLNDAIRKDIASKPGATISSAAVASRLAQTEQQFRQQVTPQADIAAIRATGQEFLAAQPSQIPVEQAQAIKQGTYQQLKKKYGQIGPASVEAQKALARGIKEELETQFPEIHDLNARESSLIGLDKSLDRAVNRIENWEQFGIGTPIMAGAAKAVTGSTGVGAVAGVMAAVLRNPMLKSKIAIALNRQGVPLNAANARVSAYLNALGNAEQNANQTTAQGPAQ